MATLDGLLKKLHPDPNVRGRQFERICKWYLTHEPTYRRQLAKVWLWNEWPGRRGRDLGIDLVAKTLDGDLWAIQAKAYDPVYPIKKADVDSFLSASARREFKYRLLIATTSKIGRNASRTLAGQEKPVGTILLGALRKAQINWPKTPGRLQAKKAARWKPLPHQREAIGNVVRGLKKADRGQLIMACGTGKTLTALWIAQRMKARRTLVLVPSLSLLSQTLREWSAQAAPSYDFAAMCVCSDETVRGEDTLVSSTGELGIPVTTEPDHVASFLRKRSRPLVVFSTYQSSQKLVEAFDQTRVPGFDLAVADEAHRCAGLGGRYATVLDATAIKARHRLFMTATPRYFTGRVKKRAREEDLEIASMDDPEHFGPVLHKLSFPEAIEKKLLSDYQVVIVGVDDATYRNYAKRGKFVTTDGEKVTDARTLASHIALAKAARKYDLRKVISFHSRVKRARDFAKELPEVIAWMPSQSRPKGGFWSTHVSGEMPAGDRDALLDHFRHLDGERGHLANARCLAEGVDVPAIDGVAFIDPKASQVDIIQAVGRAIRKSAGKKVGTIVIPVFVKSDEDAEVALRDSTFKAVWSVVEALRDHDEDMGEQIDKIRREIGRGNGVGLEQLDLVHWDLPRGIGREFVDALRLRLVERTSCRWPEWFGVLLRFVDQRGHARPPAGYIEGGRALGSWVAVQRQEYKRGQLSADRKASLEGLAGWVWDAPHATWQRAWGSLMRYVEREGHAAPPTAHVEDGHRLGTWVCTRRGEYKTGSLAGEKARDLEALPGWLWDTRSAAQELPIAMLKAYVDREGHAQVPTDHVEDRYRLGYWVANQRRIQARGELSHDRWRYLVSLPGWTWDAREGVWERGLRVLERYVEREGHALVPAKHREDEFRLGNWVNNQRASSRRGELSAERQAVLSSFEGWVWERRDALKEKHFELLHSFASREGHARVPYSHVEHGVPLGQWVSYKRQIKNRGGLSPAEVARLSGVPGWTWDTKEFRWQEGYDRLKRFAVSHGTANVPREYQVDGFSLGNWAKTQRALYRRRKLSHERVSALSKLKGWHW